MQKKLETPLTAAEQRTILESIARDPDVYPRDRIAAIKALHELGLEGRTPGDDIYPEDELALRRPGGAP